MIKVISNETFKDEVMKSDKPVLVDFFATWCGPCKMVGPVLEKLSNEYEGKVKFAKLDIDNANDLATQYSVFSVPSMLIFKGGKEVGRIVGALPPSEITKKINELI
ncbi:thioredoxin [Clostridiales bacterium]|nr:thioredoxin [Clostridiales bacterium]